jgi:hypothetical protein
VGPVGLELTTYGLKTGEPCAVLTCETLLNADRTRQNPWLFGGKPGATNAEVEDSEADLERFENWPAVIGDLTTRRWCRLLAAQRSHGALAAFETGEGQPKLAMVSIGLRPVSADVTSSR